MNYNQHPSEPIVGTHSYRLDSGTDLSSDTAERYIHTGAFQRSPCDDAFPQGMGVPVIAHQSPPYAHRPNSLSDAKE